MTSDIWMGYLVDAEADATIVYSPFQLQDTRVYGPDSDATTLAVAAILHRQNQEEVNCVTVPEGVDESTVAIACGVTVNGSMPNFVVDWEILVGDQAIVVLARSGVNIEVLDVDFAIDVDSEFQRSIDNAWHEELQANHVSQGAYVSKAQYEEAAFSRLSLQGQQHGDILVWPPRYSKEKNGENAQATHLKKYGRVASWTTLSPAGAPSEFSLRAPLLGGISTVLLRLDEGPQGVFLVVDDEDTAYEFDMPMELVLRRIYAQEGFIRYGLKARAVVS